MHKDIMNIEGKKVYIGIDVHKVKYVICATCDKTIIKSWSCPADAETFAKSLKKLFPKSELYSVYEAGFSGFWLHRKLLNEGIKNIVVHPADIEISLRDRKKTDKRDARKMSEQLSDGRLTSIYIPNEQEEMHRQVTRLREQLIKDRSRIANRIKSKLQYFGLLSSADKRVVNRSFLDWIIGLDLKDEVKLVFNILIDQWKYLSAKLEDIKVEMKIQSFETAELEEVYQSVPGIGDIGARTLANELGNLSLRFRNQKALYRYVGLTPSEYSSGESVRRGGIDRQGAARIRKILVEAAWISIRQDPALKQCYDRIASKRGATRAIVAIARKLIGRIRACFQNQTPYELGLIR